MHIRCYSAVLLVLSLFSRRQKCVYPVLCLLKIKWEKMQKCVIRQRKIYIYIPACGFLAPNCVSSLLYLLKSDFSSICWQVIRWSIFSSKLMIIDCIQTMNKVATFWQRLSHWSRARLGLLIRLYSCRKSYRKEVYYKTLRHLCG